MKFVSLFSGIGGLDLGLERAGHECILQVELDDYCRRVLEKHWPDVPRIADVRDVTAADCEGADMIVGGFPCQPVSVAGKRLGTDDERWLWPEFARLIRVVRPRFVLVENTPGLLSVNVGAAMSEVQGDLAASGYDTEWHRISAASVGAPHLRNRIFIVAHTISKRLERAVSEPVLDGGARLGSSDAQVADASSERRDARRTERTGLQREITSLSRGGAVAYSKRAGPQGHGAERGLGEGGGEAQASGRSPHVADSAEQRPPRQGQPLGPSDPAASSFRPTIESFDGRLADQWATEPDVGRVAHGVPKRVDRLRALGNAVVPQVAELVGRRLMELDT